MTHIYYNRLSRRRIAAAQIFYRSVFDPCLEFSTVKSVARGRWLELLAELGIPVEALRDQHGPCPGCGGVDCFRFDDREGHGSL